MQRFGDMGLIELIKSKKFQQQSYFNVSGLPEKQFRTHRFTDYGILSTEWRSEVDLIDMNCACYLLLSDLTMKTTTSSRQTSPHMSYMHTRYTML